jgi:hypothetical protein
MVKARLMAGWAVSFVLVCAACGVLVHRFITSPGEPHARPAHVDERTALR